MLSDYQTAVKTQARAMFNALRQSYDLPTSPSQRTRAARLAQTVKTIRPAVYQVGGAIVDLWRGSCSCKQARQRKARGYHLADKPCPHLLALYLVGEWSPTFNPTEYLKSAGVQQPAIIAYYCGFKRAKYPAQRAGYRLNLPASESGCFALECLVTGRITWAKPSEIVNLVPFYE